MTEIEKYRPKPLTRDEFQKLETLAAKFMTVREKVISKSVPKVDANGDIYAWEHDLVPSGVEVFFKADPDDRVMESLFRLASDTAIAKALTDLEAHRTYGRGNAGWGTVLRDLVNDLAGCSEWALIKTCEKFRHESGGRFFPQTSDLVRSVKNLDEQARWAYAARPSSKAAEQKPIPEPAPKKTPKSKRHVARLVKLARKPRENWTKWEQRFYASLSKPEARKHKPSGHNFGYGE